MANDFYDVLDVTADATQDEITAAYREKVKEYHPDQSDRDDASERFQAVVDAEEVLGDEAERERYDRLGHETYVGDGGTRRRQRTGDDLDFDGFDWDVDRGGTSDGWWESHHARQRRRRQTADWEWVGDSAGTASAGGMGSTGSTSGMGGPAGMGGTGGTSATSRASTAGGTTATGSTSTKGRGFDGHAQSGDDSYTVNDWETEPQSRGLSMPSITQETVFLIVVSMLLYPLLLVSTITELFFAPIRVATGLLLIATAGYLLTIPGIGVIVFGGLSVLVPGALFATGMLEPLTMRVVVGVMLVWIPLGYAVAVVSVVGR
ncbi:J domain-containing protein [Natronoarchaeum sp. GCM10025321]